MAITADCPKCGAAESLCDTKYEYDCCFRFVWMILECDKCGELIVREYKLKDVKPLSSYPHTVEKDFIRMGGKR